jgi:Mad3/BUB1 homology region 1
MDNSGTFAWENSKENAAPLPRGRRIEDLEEPEMSRRAQAAGVDGYEQRILAAAATETPLTSWIDYIKWHENHFPSQVHAQFVLLERCFLTFQSDPRFFHDSRFIRICCLYADKTQEPTQTFRELHRAGIGRDSAIFWNAWAFVAEKSGNFRLADRIFRHAVDEQRAEPLPYLLQRKKHFQKRMAKHFLESLHDPGTSGEEEDEEQHQRNIFGAVSGGAGISRAVRPGSSTTFTDRSIPSVASQFGRLEKNLQSNSQVSFPIYGDENSSLDHSLFDSRIAPSEREPEVQRWKENRGPRERWNDRTHGPSLPIAQTSAFSVYVDEQCAAENDRKEEQRLRQEEEHRQNRRGIGAEGNNGQDKKRSKPAWKKNLLKDSLGKEQCFEEARMEARCYRLVGPAANLNLIAPEPSIDNDDSSMSMCGSDDDSVMYDETAVLDKGLLNILQPKGTVPVPPPPPASGGPDVRTVIHNPSETIPVNTSWSSDVSGRFPTPTANMQYAMNQVSLMFSSPMVADDNGVGENNTPALLIRHDSPALGRENDPRRRYPDARSLPAAEPHVLHSLRQEDEGDRSALGCRRTTTDVGRRRIGPIHQDNPMAGLQEHDLPANPGFSVYEDDNGDSSNIAANNTTTVASNHAPPPHSDFSVHQGADQRSSSQQQLLPVRTANPGFTIYQDEDETEPDPMNHNNNAPLSVFRDTAEQQEAVDDSGDSVNSDDLQMFGGAAAAGEPTLTSNALDRLTLGDGTRSSSTARGKRS